MENQILVSPPPPTEEEPNSKKPKLSTTTTTNSDNDEQVDHTTTTTTTEKKQRYKRRKIAILFAYCGVGYQGMQKNPGAKTIEGDLEEALYFSGAVPESERGCPKRFDFARSARTDKGVSAVGQVVSGKFYIDPPGFIQRLNNNLPDQFRVFGFKRVTASFSAKKFCDRRRYVYLLPVFALDPSSHRDRDAVLASLGSQNELSKCLECSQIGRKLSDPLSDNSNSDGVNGEVKENVFRYGDKEKERFNKILKQYEGTHNFHNFTTRTKAADPAAKRYIISFHANTTVTVDGIEFVKCEVVGQSFMLHQIRKMIGVAVAIMRDCAPESLIETALQQDVRITVPTAPEVGLYLDECFFSSYNQKWKDTHEEVSMKAYAEEAEEFKLKHIYSHIASTEHKEGSVAVWLHSLNYRNYPDLGPEESPGANVADETSGCNPDYQKSSPYRKGNTLLDLVSSGRFCILPMDTKVTVAEIDLEDLATTMKNRLNLVFPFIPGRFCILPMDTKVTVAEIDLEHLATTMKNRLNLVFPFIPGLSSHYICDPETDITNTIICDVSMMVDAAMSVTYNRLRCVLQRYNPNVSVALMNPRSPFSNRIKFPAFISSVLGSIGPLRIKDGPKDMHLVYATSADRSQNYGRAQPFNLVCSQLDRFIENLAAIGVPLAPIDVKVSAREGSFFSTIIPTLESGLLNFKATFHHSHYKHKDIMSAWLTIHDNPIFRAFEDCSMTIGRCTDSAVVEAVVTAARSENVSDDVDGTGAVTRQVDGVFIVNSSGIQPAVGAKGGNPATGAAVYTIGRGTEQYYGTSLARSICEPEMFKMLLDFIFMPSQGNVSF